jgi:hypothetical protein
MIFVKLIKVSFLLKEFDLSQFFIDNNCNITGIINHIELQSPETLLHLCSVIAHTVQPPDTKTIATACLIDAMKTISRANVNYPSKKRPRPAKGDQKSKSYFSELWQGLNTIRLSLARVGSFDIGNMELEDAQECLDTNEAWNQK